MHRPHLLPLLLLALPISAHSQAPDLHPTIANRTYADGSITVHAPPGWTIGIDSTITTGDLTVHLPIGAILRHGSYTLRLCSGCFQVSGIAGGRFGEIASLVQPNARPDYGANPDPCGRRQLAPIAPAIDRVDLWYSRKDRHLDPGYDRCRTPSTSGAIWYGSYFTNHCPPDSPMDEGCGGNFLLRSHLNHKPAVDLDEMAFGLSFDPAKPNRFPHRNDPAFDAPSGRRPASSSPSSTTNNAPATVVLPQISLSRG